MAFISANCDYRTESFSREGTYNVSKMLDDFPRKGDDGLSPPRPAIGEYCSYM